MNPSRQVIKKISLADEGRANDYSHLTPEERLRMVWSLTLTAWRFKEPHGFQSRLSRHVGRFERRGG